MAQRMQTVTLPAAPLASSKQRTAWVTRGHGQFGAFARAGVAVRCGLMGGTPCAEVSTDVVTSDARDPSSAPTLDDALLDLERRLLEALADVRALRCELDPTGRPD